MFPVESPKSVPQPGASSGSSTSNRPSDKSKRKGWRLGNGFEAWGGYMNAKKQKLADQYNSSRHQDESSSDIFRGVSIYVNGYTNPSSDELKKLILRHGGQYEQYLYKTRVTHVIATRLPNSKVKEIKSGDKIVKPEWILDSIKEGRLLSYESYQLYTAQSSIQKGISRFASVTPSVTHASEASSFCPSTRSAGAPSQFLGNIQSAELPTSDNQGDGNGETSPQLFTPSPETPKDGVENRDKQASNIFDESFKVPLNVPSSLYSGVSSESRLSESLEQKANKSPEKNNYHGAQRTTSVAGDSTFVSDFYQHSRLHHLSTWKCEFAEYVNHLQVSSDGTYPGRDKLVKLQAEKSTRGMQTGDTTPQHTKGKPQRVIMHVDMDCFFVSVGVRERPELKGKPIAVTHSKGKGAKLQPGASRQLEKAMWESGRSKKAQSRSSARLSLPKPVTEDSHNNSTVSDLSSEHPDVMAILTSNANTVSEESEEFYSMAEIASCSYEARQAGVKNGMFMGGAKKLCPHLVTIPYDFDKYNEVSRELYSIVASYTHDIEAVSCDEMLVDCTDLLSDVGVAPLDFAAVLRQEILEKTGCTASVGLGPNILTAKMATRKAKPNGQCCLEAEDVFEFMCPQLVKDLPGIGWAMTKRLGVLGIKTCADMQKVAVTTLQKEFGPKLGQSLFRYSRGQDDRPIKIERERKSVSAEINYGIRFKQDYEAAKFLTELSEEVHNRLDKISSKGKSITLKLKVRREDAPVETVKFLGHGVCNHVTKSVTLPMATDNPQVIAKEVIGILKGLKVNVADLRGIGIQMQKLEPASLGPGISKSGHQSILSFTVPKPQTDSHKSPADLHKNQSDSDSHKPSAASNKNHQDSHTFQSVSSRNPAESKNCSHDSHLLETAAHKLADDSHQQVITLSESEERSSKFTQLKHPSSTRLFIPGQKADPPLPQLPSLTSPEFDISPVSLMTTPVRRETGENHTQDYFPSPSQVDPDVLKELPPDIREQIESAMKNRRDSKQKTAVIPKPQAMGEQDEVPGCSHWSSQDRPPKTVVGEDPVGLENDHVSETAPGWSTPKMSSQIAPLPSPSQVDPDVLRELPPDIREQIESAMKSRSDRKQKAAVNQTKQPIIEQESDAGRPQWSRDDPVSDVLITGEKIGVRNNPRPQRSTRASDIIVPLPSLSQLDMDCLNALPEDLQRELQQAYAVQEEQNIAVRCNSPGKMTAWATIMSTNRSPSKKSPNKKGRSPNRSKRNSPQFKIPQGKPGRKKKQSSKKLDFTRPVSEKSSCPDVEEIPGPTSASDVPNIPNVSADIPTITHSVPEVVETETREVTGVNLCGRVTLFDVKVLLREWLQSCPAPDSEDVRVIVQYFGELVVDKNLELVDLLLKFLRRQVKQLSTNGWSKAFLDIVTNTQDIIFSQHGSRLKEFNL